jgi:uncharacterized protein (TIGR00730 family)
MDIADAFVALPGGIGTYDELLEVAAWRQLRKLDKPVVLLDVEGFFQPWQLSLRHAADEGFVDHAELARLLWADTVPTLLDLLDTP